MIAGGKLLSAILLAASVAGCASPPAAVELITAARKGIRLARENEAALRTQSVMAMAYRMAVLDAAFDADVRQVAAGQVRKADGSAVALSPEWIISARKGYSAARGLLEGQARTAEAAHLTRLDNLKATDESLEMASQLIARQWRISEQMRQHVLNIQRSLIHD